MVEFFGINFLVSIAWAAVALFGMQWGLRFVDKREGRPWTKSIETIRSDARASAIFYGLRYFGSAIVVAAFILGG